MSNRVTYAHHAAVLADWVLTCGESAAFAWREEGREGMPPGAEAAAIDFFVAHLADGGGIPEFCLAQGLQWGVFAAWLKKSPERDMRFKQGLADRGMLRKERLLDLLWKSATIDVPDEAATHADVHRSREALLKAEGMLAGVSAKGSVTLVFDETDAKA